MTLCFLVLLFVLSKYAWKPVMKSLREREHRIEDALNQAEQAREEMKQLKFSNEELLKQAKEERDNILKEARKVRESIIEEAREKANSEATRIIDNARESIQYEKLAAITELKNQIAILSIEIAEKVIGQELSKDDRQKQLIDKMLGEVNFN
jgi:F-type H+-transporting ATPase subunit b